MIQNVGNISQIYSALSAETSPIKQFVDQKSAENHNQNQSVASQVNLQSDRYRDFMEISKFIPSNNGECNCGKCERCLGKDNRNPNQNKNDDSFKKTLGDSDNYSKKDQEKIKELQKRDQEVHTHEQAHVRAGAKNAQYKYETGPDGKQYATGGHAEIETSKGSNPNETISKAQQIKKAALAPSNPSSQDRKVAAEADKMEADASQETNKRLRNDDSINDKSKPDNGNEPDGNINNDFASDNMVLNQIKEKSDFLLVNASENYNKLNNFSLLKELKMGNLFNTEA